MEYYRYFIELAFCGTNYFGWQVQNGQTSVQEVVNKCLSLILKKEINIVGASRTDTGVHARQIYAHFNLEILLPQSELDLLTHKLNAFLPYDIAIKNIFAVKPDVHARFSAQSRTYNYIISNKKNPFMKHLAYFVYGNLDIEQMNKAAQILFNYEDFSSFCKTNVQLNNYNCKIYHAEWKVDGDLIIFTISANRFLRNMVRAIVGTLLEVGQGKITIEDFANIIETHNRCKAGQSVSADGLYLTEIKYPDNIYLN